MPLPARAAGNAAPLRLGTAAAGPGCRSRKQRKALFYTRPGRRPCRAARHPPSAGAVAHGVGTAARRPPGPSPAWGWDCRPSPAGPDCRSRKQREALFYTRPGRRPVRGWDCRSSARRARPPEPEATESPSHAKPGPPPTGLRLPSSARRDAPDDGQYAKSGERCHILSCQYVIYANFMQHGR